jgi:hypothetical protein
MPFLFLPTIKPDYILNTYLGVLVAMITIFSDTVKDKEKAKCAKTYYAKPPA